MSKTPSTDTPLPAYGTIHGGKFDGWAYSFVAFLTHPTKPTLVRLHATPPGWPFPSTVDVPYPSSAVTFMPPAGAIAPSAGALARRQKAAAE